MLKFFKDCKNLEDVKKTYRKLCFKYHPDIYKDDNGETMKAINNEYEIAFKMFKDKHETKNTNSEPQNATETPEMFKDIINGLINCDGVQIDIVGSWVWLTGNTYAHKDTIKGLGFKWASKKKAWYWHSENDGCGRHSKMTLDQIKDKYGCQTVHGKKPLQLA
ncbi:MAG: molecular chaperone DnaJ [Acutalibacteraceae bacterium]